MKSKKLKNALKKFNEVQEATLNFEVLNSKQAGAIKGGMKLCMCKKSGVTCSQSYTIGPHECPQLSGPR